MGLWTAAGRSIMDRRPLPHAGAHQSSASGRSGAQELRSRGKGGEGRAGELNGGVITGREVVEGRLTGGEAQERGRTPERCGGGGVLRRLFQGQGEERRRSAIEVGSGIVKLHYQLFWEGIGRVVGSDEG
jgi:hypothetical protein